MNRTYRMKRILTVGVALAALGMAGAASAQSATPAAQDDSAKVDDVVVTAQKRTERLLDVPMSVTATSGEELSNAGIGSTSNLQHISPGLVTVNNGFAFTPAIRGISSVGTSAGDEANVSMYLDDVYIGAPLAGMFDLKDIQRVEVLKGPQGTLFGRNATGGALRIVTLAPSFTPRAELSADYGFDFKQVKLGAYVTGPITSTIAGSLNLFHLENDGYVESVAPALNGARVAKADNSSIRGKLLFQPSDTLQFTLAADYSDRSDNTIFSAIPRDGMNLNASTPGVLVGSLDHYPGGTFPIIDTTAKGVSLDGTWNPSDYLTVRSITAYRSASGLFQTDTDRSSAAVSSLRLIQDQDTFSQEFNFSGPSEDRLSWIGGLFYYHSTAGNPYFQAVSGNAPSGTVVSNFTDTVKTTSYAAFGELNYDFTDKLHGILGARYTSEKKQFDFADIVRAAGLRTSSAENTWESPTFRGVLQYDFTPDSNIYISASNGFKSGVYNSYSLPAIPVAPEKITAVEIGAKGRFSGLTLTAAAFWYDYTDIQVTAYTSLPGGAYVSTLNNAAAATVKGFEFTARGPITDHLSFDVGLSALPTANYDEYTTASVFIPNPVTGGATSVVPYDASGSRMLRAPKYQANARLTYENTVAGGELYATANLSYNDGFYWQAGNLTQESSYTTINARAAWTDPQGLMTYSLWVENLTDERYSMNSTNGAPGLSDAFSPPRLVGIGIAAHF
jgi:iron complex outermembrane receptor protein